VKYTPFYHKNTLNFGGQLKELSSPLVMGILNLTPDSFYSNSRFSHDNLVDKVGEMIDANVDIIDIGGYSSRPGAADIPVEAELERVIPAIEFIIKHFDQAIISIDTFRSKVARQAVNSGAKLINDIMGGSGDPEMFKTVAELKVPYILMHMKGTPQTMQSKTDYKNIIAEIILYFSQKIDTLNQLGIKDVIIDPGFGFSKTITQNFHLLKHLEEFQILNTPILAGFSRKSFIYKTLEIDSSNALNGTTVINSFALTKSVDILRVHDVKEAKELVKLFTFMQKEI
jgi:dihydropteroate synthase